MRELPDEYIVEVADDGIGFDAGAADDDGARVSCDYYDFLDGDLLALNVWQGEYMEQYSWAEATKASLLR